MKVILTQDIKSVGKKGQIIEKNTRRNKIFYGCNNFPKCKTATWDKPTGEFCPNCKSLIVEGKTGLEMEALHGVSAALLTIYDMCKAVQKDIVITDICLVEKTGGIHGSYRRED